MKNDTKQTDVSKDALSLARIYDRLERGRQFIIRVQKPNKGERGSIEVAELKQTKETGE